MGSKAVSVPTGLVGTRVQVVGRAWATVALVVVVERQIHVRWRKAGIGLIGPGAEGTHHGRQQDDQTKEKGLIFHNDLV